MVVQHALQQLAEPVLGGQPLGPLAGPLAVWRLGQQRQLSARCSLCKHTWLEGVPGPLAVSMAWCALQGGHVWKAVQVSRWEVAAKSISAVAEHELAREFHPLHCAPLLLHVPAVRSVDTPWVPACLGMLPTAVCCLGCWHIESQLRQAPAQHLHRLTYQGTGACGARRQSAGPDRATARPAQPPRPCYLSW